MSHAQAFTYLHSDVAHTKTNQFLFNMTGKSISLPPNNYKVSACCNECQKSIQYGEKKIAQKSHTYTHKTGVNDVTVKGFSYLNAALFPPLTN